MRRRGRGMMAAIGLVVVPFGAWQLATPAQQAGATPGRFQFQIVQSFDAKYLGDTPGHLGRGNLRGARPDVALGDPVFRGTATIGKVSGLVWDRAKESLEVEFDPEPFEEDEQGRPLRPARITVGQEVWVALGKPEAAKPR